MGNKIHIIDLQNGRTSIGGLNHLPDERQKWSANLTIPRHRHTTPYATLVLSGGLEECGNRGRFAAEAGKVLLHGAFDSHVNHVFTTGAHVLHMRLPGFAVEHSFGRVRDADMIVRTAETDLVAATDLLIEQLTPIPFVAEDWPDLLAASLIAEPTIEIANWASSHKLALPKLNHRFARMYGISPEAFQADLRAHKAFDTIVEGTRLLSKVLELSGFGTETHLVRAIKSLTGATPKAWVTRSTLPYFAI